MHDELNSKPCEPVTESNGVFSLLASLPNDIKEKITEYVDFKCKEQKVLCLKSFELSECGFGAEGGSIMNAPKPLFRFY